MDLNAQTSTTTKSLCLKGHRCTYGSMLLWSETSKEQWFKCSRLRIIKDGAIALIPARCFPTATPPPAY